MLKTKDQINLQNPICQSQFCPQTII
uniref:Uncharacterized protein n=1 Tax=Rhizophora mucronata TaxID=61149 RepID=A0A2P2MBQ9_RHIMU